MKFPLQKDNLINCIENAKVELYIIKKSAPRMTHFLVYV